MQKGCLGFSFLALSAVLGHLAAAAERFPLKVSADHRHLAEQSGAPFLWLGDTSWPLFAQINRESVLAYLENRKAKGFTVIQSHLLPWSITGTNAYGHTPFLNGDMTQPSEPYWQHVDWLIAQAGQRGFVSALLMASAANYEANGWLTPANARTYGRFLGARYKNFAHIVWLGGGDFSTRAPDLWRALAAGIEEGQGGHTRLMTFHPRGPGTSSYDFHRDAWEDFDMVQSSVQTNPKWAYENIAHDYALTPPKPTLNGEPAYEWMQSTFSPMVVRRNAYATFFSGGCGLTYGADPVWNIGAFGWQYSGGAWVANMDFDGAFHMGFLKDLLLSYAWAEAGPDTVLGSVIAPADRGIDNSYVSGLVAYDSSFALTYLPDDGTATSRTVQVLLNRFSEPVYAQWFDPTSGLHTSAGGPFPATGTSTFTAPGLNSGGARDWVLELFAARWINLPPIASITRPVAETSLVAPAALQISATASDPDGSVARVEFFIGTTKIGEATSAPFLILYSGLDPGEYTLTAKAWDNRALSGISAPVQLHVGVPAASAATATLHVTADDGYAAIYLNGTATAVGPQAQNWGQADAFAGIANLQCVALKCVNNGGSGAGAMIAKVSFQNGITARSDFGWKVAYSVGGAPPADDAAGRKWYETNYDDRAWPTAKSAGAFGVAPWGNSDGLAMMAGSQWIWYRDPNNAVTPIYLRKTFGLAPVQAQPPVSITPQGTRMLISWASIPGTKYRVQSTRSLANAFTDLEASEVTATATTTFYSDTPNADAALVFYRVRTVP